MKLIDGWRADLNRLWSVRIAIFTALLAAGDQILTAINGTGVISPLAYALLSGAIVAARLLQQATPVVPAPAAA